MIETEWLCGDHPANMLRYYSSLYRPGTSRRLLTSRKLRLACCGVSRLAWDALDDPRWRLAVEAGELYADGKIEEEPLAIAWGGANFANRPDERGYSDISVLAATCAAYDSDLADTLPRWIGPNSFRYGGPRAAVLRDVFGNPFRSLPGGEIVNSPVGPGTLTGINDRGFPMVNGVAVTRYTTALESWLRWDNGTIPRLAEGIYQDRAWGRMPYLADALLDAGCDSDDVIMHCKGFEFCCLCQGTGAIEYPMAHDTKRQCICKDGWIPLRSSHVRGCWVLDLLLGKE